MIKNNNSGRSRHLTAVRKNNFNSRYTPPVSRAQVVEKLRSIGFEHLERVPDTGGARIPARGKSPGNRSASVKYSDNGMVLHWHEFTSGSGGTCFGDSHTEHNSAELAKRIQADKERTKERESERHCLQQKVAKLAQKIYRNGSTEGTHPYVEKKQLSGLHNARIEGKSGALLIPISIHGIGVVNVQRIFKNGDKRFLSGAKVKGAYSVIGSLNQAEGVLVCEGWATGATLHEVEGLPVVVAFNAGNLMAVCQSLRTHFSNLTVCVAGDDDRQTLGNPGRRKAIEAAEAIGANVAFPRLCKCCKCTDHNDALVCARSCDRE